VDGFSGIYLSTMKNQENMVKSSYTPSYTHYPQEIMLILIKMRQKIKNKGFVNKL